MARGGRGPDSEAPGDRSVYSSNRRRTRSRLRAGAVATAVVGAVVVGFTLANLYVPDATNPVDLDPIPVVSLGMLGAAGGLLMLFSLLVYVLAHRAGV